MGKSAPLGVSASGLPASGDLANAVVSGVLTAIGPGKPFAFYGAFNLAVWGDVQTPLTTTAGSTTASVGSGTGISAGTAINSVNVPRGTTVFSINSTTVILAMPTRTLYGTPQIYTANGGSVGRIKDLTSTDGLLGSIVSGTGIPSGTTVAEIVTAAVAPTNDSPGIKGTVRLSAAPTSVPTNKQPLLPFEFALNGNAITVTGADANASFTNVAADFSATFVVERSFDGCATFIPCNIGGTGTIASYNAGTAVSLTIGEPEREVFYRINVTAYTSGRVNYRFSETGQAAMSLSVPTAL